MQYSCSSFIAALASSTRTMIYVFFFVFASGHPTIQKNCDRQTHTIYNYWDVCVCARVRDAHIRLKRGVRRLARVCVLVSDGECM